MKFPILLTGLSCTLATARPTWNVFHSWNGGRDFTRRGVLEYKSDDETFVMINDEGVFTPESVQQMLDFGWYQVKIDTTGQDFVMATVPACDLRRSNFKEEFILTLPRMAADEHEITSLAYSPLISALAPKTCDDQEGWALPDPIVLTSKVSANSDTPAMTIRAVLPTTKPPPGLTWLQHPSRGTRADSASATGGSDTYAPPGAEKETPAQPWFVRYWYVVVPLVIMNFMGGAAPPEGQQQAPGGQAAAPVAAAAPASGGRRGKRG